VKINDIEARLSYYAYKCFFEEFSPDIVDMKRNYLDNKSEPEFLPSRYPNVLINNTFGIGLTL
jgi:DNA gyrase/topoisomerase IV subunit A